MNAYSLTESDNLIGQACNKLLGSLLGKHASLQGMVMTSVDGHAFAQAFQQSHSKEAARIAAIASSVMALSESFSGETLAANTRYNCVNTDRGNIVTVRIPSRSNKFVLCCWADNSDNFAMTLRFTLDAASKLAALVDRSQ